MSDDMISPGDLVILVRGHSCTMSKLGGMIFVVAGFRQPKGGGWRCDLCNKLSAGPNETGLEFDGYPGGVLPISWVRRIPPIAELETRETETIA